MSGATGGAHWLAEQVATLRAHPGTHAQASAEERRGVVAALEGLCQTARLRPGVVAVVAVFEGLPVAGAGDAPMEELAALVQRALLPGDRGFWELLGDCQQLLLIGSQRKLAVVAMDQLALGILSVPEVRLAEVMG